MIGKKKLSFLLLGLGIGILLTNFIYYMFPKIEYENLSDEEIVEKAKELGMVFVKDVIQVDNISEDKEYKEYISGKKTMEENLQEVVFQIEQGQSLETIAENLYSIGLIDDINRFISYAKERNMATRFRVGTYNLSVGMDYEVLVTILTKKDLKK